MFYHSSNSLEIDWWEILIGVFLFPLRCIWIILQHIIIAIRFFSRNTSLGSILFWAWDGRTGLWWRISVFCRGQFEKGRRQILWRTEHICYHILQALIEHLTFNRNFHKKKFWFFKNALKIKKLGFFQLSVW